MAGSLAIGLGPDNVHVLYHLPGAGFLRPRSELFIAGTVGNGDLSVFERLCFRNRELAVVVRTPRDLEGLVDIQSPGQAVAFARLFTSPATVKCLEEPWWAEVVPRWAVGPRLLLGRSASDLCIAWEPSGAFGVLSAGDWARSGLLQASVRRSGGDFAVTRPLMSGTAKRHRTHVVYVVEETVSRRGEFKRRDVRCVRLPYVTLSIPVEPM